MIYRNTVARWRGWAAGLTVLMFLLLSSATAHAEPPLGSRAFLCRHVHSVADLRRELNRDPRLIQIYGELLHMSPEQVKTEFSRLKLTRLPEEGIYKIYGVSNSNGRLTYSFKVRRLPRGIDVFTLEDGRTPVILRQCGNLLRGYFSTPGPEASNVPVFNEMYPDAGLPRAPGLAPESITLESPVRSEFNWVEDTVAAAPLPDLVPPPALLHAARSAWWPWLFPLIGVPFIAGGGGGGGGGGVLTPLAVGPIFVPDSTSALAAVVQPSVEIPEPGPVAVAAAAAVVAAAATMRRRGPRRSA